MVLVFDLRGDQAMFRKPYTTTSMVSFAFPPPTAVCGLLGAIVGIDHGSSHGAFKAQYWKAFEGVQTALALTSPVAWYTTAVNLIRFKTPNGNLGEHIQVGHQFLKRPSYRIYVRGGRIYKDLKMRLKRGEFVFTPYLGVAFALADLTYVGEFPDRAVDGAAASIDSVLPWYGNVELDVARCGSLYSEIVPFRLDGQRRQQRAVSVVYSDGRGGRKIFLQDRGGVEVTRVGSEVVAWFECW